MPEGAKILDQVRHFPGFVDQAKTCQGSPGTQILPSFVRGAAQAASQTLTPSDSGPGLQPRARLVSDHYNLNTI